MLNSKAFPNSLVLSNGNDVTIGNLDKLNELQTRTVRVPPLSSSEKRWLISHYHLQLPYANRNPIKITHDPENRVFGIALVASEAPPSDNIRLKPSVSALELLNDISYLRESSPPILRSRFTC